MENISEFGIRIKNIKAGMVYDTNIGVRDYFTYTEAMLNNSLFSYHLKENGINIHKNAKNKKEFTRDIICLDFDFGSRSYEDEKKRLETLKDNTDSRKNYIKKKTEMKLEKTFIRMELIYPINTPIKKEKKLLKLSIM